MKFSPNLAFTWNFLQIWHCPKNSPNLALTWSFAPIKHFPNRLCFNLFNDSFCWIYRSVQRAEDFDQSVHFVNRNAKNYDNPMEMEIPSATSSRDIECEINKEYTVQCRREDNEVYLPFSFLQNYFEVHRRVNIWYTTCMFIFTLMLLTCTFSCCTLSVPRAYFMFLFIILWFTLCDFQQFCFVILVHFIIKYSTLEGCLIYLYKCTFSLLFFVWLNACCTYNCIIWIDIHLKIKHISKC